MQTKPTPSQPADHRGLAVLALLTLALPGYCLADDNHHFSGAAQITYRGETFSAAFSVDDPNLEHVPGLDYSLLCRITLVPFDGRQRLSGQIKGDVTSWGHATPEGHMVVTYGPFALDLLPIDGRQRMLNAQAAGYATGSTVGLVAMPGEQIQQNSDGEPGKGSIVLIFYRKAK